MSGDPVALAEAHRVTQVKSAVMYEAALGQVFSRHLDPYRLDASFPAYLRAALSVLSVGRSSASGIAGLYYHKARSLADTKGIIPTIKVPDLNVAAVTTSLYVTGPASVKKFLSAGGNLQAAMNHAKANTLGAGKRIVLNGGRQTIIDAAHNDSAALGWARISDGAPCDLCAKLLSRGPVYKSRATASFRSHDRCGCGVRPFFEGDPSAGWTPDAKALSDLWASSGPSMFSKAYADALVDKSSQVHSTMSHKVGEQISRPVVQAANKAAREAHTAAVVARQAAEEAAAKAADSEASREAAAESKRIADEAAKEATLRKKWLGKPAPKKPLPPEPPQKVGPAAFDQWLQSCKDRFAAHAAATGNPKSDLTKSINWHYFENVVKNHDMASLNLLKSQHYVDKVMLDEAVAAMKAAEEILPGQADSYKSALRAYRNRATRHDRYMQEWRQVNGIGPSPLKGMDGAIRHTSNEDGVRWADTNLKVASGKSSSAIKRYSGSDYRTWNAALRKGNSESAPRGEWEAPTQAADRGFSPAPADVIVHRGTRWDEFELQGGKRVAVIPPPPPTSLVGTVQTQSGYMSTSVGTRSAFGGNAHMKIRVPEGHPVSWVQPYPQFSSERELLISRQTNYYVHAVYQNTHGQWVVECEILPHGFDVADASALSPMPSTVSF